MKRLYGFNSKEIAEELKRQGETGLRGGPMGSHAIGNEIRIVKLAEDANSSGTTEENSVEGPYTANEQFFGSDSLVLAEEDTPVEMDVYNYSPIGYTTGDVVTVARWRTMWVIVGGVGGVKTFVTNSTVTARNGEIPGTGTAVSYNYNKTSGLYVPGSETPPFNIINPYAAEVSTSVVIQCHAVGGKWEIIQSECEGA